ncbi:Bax inhibitor-1/YccA family protein [Nitrogeniibacter aestuarii]|uniref:Bax inhibitor-1/YccA family protein n=1 Tax=Nitrogeniibacter aestuarii TaxID=2815343 RepID=UPI001D117896|nr:Bax inhibitor-1 family protein [Nitrogeniibacter aestuarii]
MELQSTSVNDQVLSRPAFIRSTYLHLAVAIVAFAVLSALCFFSGIGFAMLKLLSGAPFGWLAMLGGFMVVSWIATRFADTAESRNQQLTGLGLYVLADTVLFAPMFALAAVAAPGAISSAVLVTALLVAGLTWTAMTAKTDFSFLGGFLKIGGLVALGAIVMSVFMGFTLGIWFSAAMILFAAGAILYDTSNIIRHYPTDRPAGAALHLFASVTLLLWYVLRFLMQLANSD